jgi:hypothetical protein
MEEKELLSLALAQSSQIGGYWTLYIAVTGALIGVLTAEKVVLSGWLSRAVTTLLFALFSYSNLMVGIAGAVRIRIVALSMVHGKQLVELKKAGDGPPLWLYVAFHLMFDLAAVAAIWRLPVRRHE